MILPRQIFVNTNAKVPSEVMFIVKVGEVGDHLPLFSDKYRKLVKNKQKKLKTLHDFVIVCIVTQGVSFMELWSQVLIITSLDTE